MGASIHRLALWLTPLAILAALLSSCRRSEAPQQSAPAGLQAMAGRAQPTVTPAFSDDFAPPMVLREVRPELPASFPDTAHAVVLVSILVDTTGRVAQPEIIEGPLALRDAAIRAVGDWEFVPAGGREDPRPVRIVVPVRFAVSQPKWR